MHWYKRELYTITSQRTVPRHRRYLYFYSCGARASNRTQLLSRHQLLTHSRERIIKSPPRKSGRFCLQHRPLINLSRCACQLLIILISNNKLQGVRATIAPAGEGVRFSRVIRVSSKEGERSTRRRRRGCELLAPRTRKKEGIFYSLASFLLILKDLPLVTRPREDAGKSVGMSYNHT